MLPAQNACAYALGWFSGIADPHSSASLPTRIAVSVLQPLARTHGAHDMTQCSRRHLQSIYGVFSRAADD
ncbi:hypothetical protein LMG29542_06701 [Paraburkholderia humisilvae]|uniref:Uncharacterized protein n=1 Tax=Paraburkholderia humisilvae TaxID=627669 RepID=A0A6J5F3A5_9BURK|nr:hypothetical protein LMG29542_06701 [Paraburkholderia humisilvae]